MRPLLYICAFLSVTDASVVSCEGVSRLQGLPITMTGYVVYQNHLWQAQNWAEQLPSSNDPSWIDLGECQEHLSPPPCTAPLFDFGAVYTGPTTVTYNSTLFRNRWWSVGIAPSDDLANWYAVSECVSEGIVTTTTTAKVEACPPTTTTAIAGVGPSQWTTENGGIPATTTTKTHGQIPPTTTTVKGELFPPTTTTAKLGALPPTTTIAIPGVAPSQWTTENGGIPVTTTTASHGQIPPTTTTAKGELFPPTTTTATVGAVPPTTTTTASHGQIPPTTTISKGELFPPATTTVKFEIIPTTTTHQVEVNPFTTTADIQTSTTGVSVIVPSTSTTAIDWDGGPVGPNGECVWPNWNAQIYTQGEYVTLNNTVYRAGHWVDGTVKPPNAPWSAVAPCSGENKMKWTVEELLSQIDPDGPEYQQILDPSSLLQRWTISNLKSKEQALRSLSTVAQEAASVSRVATIDEIEAIVPGRADNPDNVKRVESFLSEQAFNTLFPIRNRAYTYSGLLKAIGAFPAYCQTYHDGRDSDVICKKILATSFAHFTQEVGANWDGFEYGSADHLANPDNRNTAADDIYATGTVIPQWKQALWWLREIGHSDSLFSDAYRQCGVDAANRVWGLNFQCPNGKGYFGRGSKQLSWNYNYGSFSNQFYNNSLYLLENPSIVAETWLNFASAIWFAVTPQSPKPAMLHVVDGTFKPNDADLRNGVSNGFGATIDIINGGIECRSGGSNPVAVDNRVKYYREYMNYFRLSIDASEQLDCRNTVGFTTESAGAVLTYLDKGSANECSLVSWQTPWKITVDGDYERCVKYWFMSNWVSKSQRKVISSYGGESIY